jgi:uncharacterized protein YgbK (DUF1537 family)
VPQIAIVADDLTGAADTGARFAQAGALTMLALAAAEPPESDVLVISTESRHLKKDQAALMVRQAVQRVGGDVDRVYKKIDSTLRGHPGPELAAVMDGLGLERALVAPAFPAQGRTTVGGRQLVDGRPVEYSSFGCQVRGSDLVALFGQGAGRRPARLVELSVVRRGSAAVCEAFAFPGPNLLVADAETEVDLMTLAQAALTCGLRLLCGSAGLARALAAAWSWDSVARSSSVGMRSRQGKAAKPSLPTHPLGPALVVAGSRHQRTARQVAVAQGRGALVLRLRPGGLGDDDQGIERTIERAAEHLAQGRDVILTTIGLADLPLGEQGVAACLAGMARRLVIDRQVGRLVLTGGDITAATCAALEASTLWLQGEIQPGIAWGVLLGGLLPGLPVVTKAGGFGTGDTLVAAISRQLAH